MRLATCQTPYQWTPFQAFDQELERLFGAANQGLTTRASVYAPSLDIREDKENVYVALELLGVSKDAVTLTLDNGVLSITGEHKSEPAKDGTEVHRQERFFGRFERHIKVGKAVNVDGIKATQKDGVLTVTLPKTVEAKPRPIDISVN